MTPAGRDSLALALGGDRGYDMYDRASLDGAAHAAGRH